MKLFQTMPCRVKSYESALDGLNLTDKYLVAFNDICNSGNNIFMPAGYTDYVGSFIYIPFIAKNFELDINVSTFLFFTIYGLICICISIFGLLKLYKSKLSRIHGIFSIISLGTIFVVISDTYCFYGLTSLALIPWWSKLINLKYENYKKFFLIFILTGIIIGISNTVRGHSGTDILLSIIILILIKIIFKKDFKKVYSLGFILIPIILINLFILELKKESRDYLINNTDIKNQNVDLNFIRAIWHNAYYSLGYLSEIDNRNVPENSDGYSIEKAQSINPDVILHSKEYEMILKKEYFKFIKNEPLLYLKIIASKFGVILFYSILIINIGFIYIKKNKFNLNTNTFFLTGILFNSLLGIMAEPNYTYLLGLFAFCAMYTTKLIEDSYQDLIKKR